MKQKIEEKLHNKLLTHRYFNIKVMTVFFEVSI